MQTYTHFLDGINCLASGRTGAIGKEAHVVLLVISNYCMA